ncbi:MAG: amino acid racemase [Desulfovibrionaceae bacterium]
MKAEKSVGILGGMGPEATVELLRRIVAGTKAAVDNDHIRCIVDQNSKVPNRVDAIQGRIPSAGPVLADMARRLEAYGADMLCMPCNTAHYYLDEIRAASRLPFVDMLNCTALRVRERYPAAKQAAVLCTVGTRSTGLDEQRLAKYGIEAVYPDAAQQEIVTAIIAGVKGGQDVGPLKAQFQQVIDTMLSPHTPVCIAACTELSVICPQHPAVVDALDALVDALITAVKG